MAIANISGNILSDSGIATSSLVPTSRTLTINGETYDLSADRTWTITAGVSGSGTTNYVSKFTSSTVLGDSLFYDNGTQIGLGTTTPLGLLHLYQSAATTRMVMDGDAGQSKIITFRTSGLQRFGMYVNSTAESGSNVGSDFQVRAYNDAGTLLSTPLFIKRSTGNVGVNTITPAYKLDVNGTSRFVGNAIYDASVGIGATTLTGFNLLVSKNITGATTAYGISSGGTVQSDVTGQANYFISSVSTAATTFTLPNLYHYRTFQGTFGAGSTVTNQFAFFAGSNLIGATNNYGFYGAIPAGTNRWNLYMNGTANNYMAGNLGLGTTGLGAKFDIYNNIAFSLASLVSAIDTRVAVRLRGRSSATNTLAISSNGDTDYAFQVVNAAGNGAGNIQLNPFGGSVGIGATSLTEFNLRLQKNIVGSTTSYGISSEGTIQSTVTTGAAYYSTSAATQATTFTLANLYHYVANQGTLGAGSTITNQYGFFANTQTNATNNFGFYGNIASGTNRWNLYMNGTANNYMAGSLGIGATSIAAKLHIKTALSTASSEEIALRVESNPTGGTADRSIELVVKNDGTAANTYGLLRMGDQSTNADVPNQVYITASGDSYMRGGGFGIGTSRPSAGPILAIELTNGGSGYVDGTYSNVRFTSVGQSLYAEADFIVSGGVVTSVTLVWGGSNYIVGQALTTANTNLGGSGSGLIVTVTNVDNSLFRIQSSSNTDISLLKYNVSVVAGENIGTIKWENNDATVKASGIYAKIGAFAASTSGGAYLSFFTRAGANTQLNEAMRIGFDGGVAIGNTALAQLSQYGLLISKPIRSATIAYSVFANTNVQSTVTNQANYFATNAGTDDSSFTLSSLVHYNAQQSTFGAGSTVTNQYGFAVSSTLIGATNNYGFFSNIASGTNRWNLYMNGTANNYMAGSLGIGSTSLGGSNLRIQKSLANTVISYGVMVDGVIESEVTSNAVGYSTNLSTRAASFTAGAITHYQALQSTIGAGSTVNNQRGFVAGNNLIGATNNYAFVGQIPSGTGRWNLYMDGTAANYLAGSLGIGSTSLTGYTLRVAKNITGATSAYSIANLGIIQSDVTSNAYYNFTTASTAAASFTLGTLGHYRASQGTFGAGSSVTSQYGFWADNLLVGATNNYGFFGDIASGTGRWNLYMNGTANNYLAGSLGIGATSLAQFNIRISKSITGSATSYSIQNDGVVQSTVSTAIYNATTASTAAASFTLSELRHYQAQQGTIGAGSTVTNQYGFFVDASLIGATNDYGFYGAIASGTNRWNLFMNGTASNYLAGKLLVGSTTDGGAAVLQVTGAATFTSTVTASSLIKSGGTAAQILAANGSVITAGTGITISAGVISSTATGGVTSFNTRTGAVTLTSGDVTGALGFTPYNATNPDGYITSSGSITGTSAGVLRTVSGTNTAELVRGNMADNDQFRILIGGTGSNAGYVEIATADDGTEPIYVRQYTGVFSTLTRTLTLLDGSGNTTLPGALSGTSATFSSSVTADGAQLIFNASSGTPAVSNSLWMTESSSSAIWQLYIGGSTNSFAGGLGFLQNGSAKMVINTSGYVGIGTTSPNTSLEVKNNDTSNGTIVLRLQNMATNGYTGAHLYGSDGAIKGHFGWGNGTSNTLADKMYFGTIAAKDVVFTTNDSVKSTIKSGGNFLIGTTTDSGYKLNVNGSVIATNFYESSDLRLKNIITKQNSNNFGAVTFNWKDERDTKLHWGYVAQEVALLLPDAVNEGSDGMLSVDYNQAHTYKIAQLEDKIAQLEELIKTLL
jgi:hypothetical protein